MVTGLRPKIALSLLLALAVLIGLALYGDVRALPSALRDFGWHYVPLILGLTLLNYGLRFGKWQYYLARVGIRGLSWRTSLAIFLAGFALLLTPGKVGEVVKSYFLRSTTGAPIARTAPIVMAERLTDGVAMALLCLVGLTLAPSRQTWIVLGVTVGVLLAMAVVLQWRSAALWLLGLGERLPLAGRFAHSLHEFYESAADLLRPAPLFLGVGIGIVSWAMEGVAFYFVLRGLGLPGSLVLLQQAIFILAFATIVGAVVMMPGGLGGAEASMTGLLQLIVGTPDTLAVAATLLIRFGTLWFGVVLGALALWLNRRRFFEPSATSEQSPLVSGQEACSHQFT
ncbi:MAG TPA: lysylphosphatidylglycerol synthase transmembrane domain-containing protein [Ardenticatenaceae bacterium]|nr:lysylphosphatidylglycerol synthase transmembrane domain-containing protein [Ardenticatenaceae bacterium]